MNQRSGKAAKSEKRKAKSEKRKAGPSASLGMTQLRARGSVTSAGLGYERGGSVGSALDQLKRTYWKSRGLPFTPFTGGAIQLANLPSSATRPLIRDWT